MWQIAPSYLVSQCSLVMHFRCSKIFNDYRIAVYRITHWWKNSGNQWTFGKVIMAKTLWHISHTHNVEVSLGDWTTDGLKQFFADVTLQRFCDTVNCLCQTVLCWCKATLLNSSMSESSLRSGSSSSWKSLSSVVNWWKPTPLRPCDNKLPRFSRRLCRLTPKHGNLPDNRQTSLK